MVAELAEQPILVVQVLWVVQTQQERGLIQEYPIQLKGLEQLADRGMGVV